MAPMGKTDDKRIAARASVIVLAYRSAQRLLKCLRSLRDHESAFHKEIVVGLNQVPADELEELKDVLAGAPGYHSSVNLGFSGGNNLAARYAAGDYLIFLNDDSTIQPGWLDALVNAADSNQDAGAIGSRILFPNETFQEAGGIIWSDGTTAPVGRGLPRNWPCFQSPRTVAYSSANGLLVRRRAFEEIGGFDESYYPAYYEDVDLCMSLRHKLGLEVYYEPDAALIHEEAASTDPSFRGFLFRRNVVRLRSKWERELRLYPDPKPDFPNALKLNMLGLSSNKQSLLVIDDRLPDSGLGSGFGRLEELLIDLHDKNVAVDFYARYPDAEKTAVTKAALANIVETPILDHLRQPGVRYDSVVISRPHNFENFAQPIRDLLPDAALIYDAEALFHRRIQMQAALERDPQAAAKLEDEAAEMEAFEESIARSSDALVCISTEEQRILERVPGHCPIWVMPPIASSIVMGSESLTGREAIVFVAGWLAGPQSPNILALRWFVERSLPSLKEMVPNARILVTGKAPPDEVVELALQSGVELLGYVGDLPKLYSTARVAIAPIVYGAGVKIKAVEAMQYGVPVVATNIGAEGVGFVDNDGIDITDDPVEFARRIGRLMRNDEAWMERRRQLSAVIARLMHERISWAEVLEKTLEQKRLGAPAANVR